MFRNTIPVGRIFGIPVNLDYSWFLVVVLITWMLAATYYPSEFPNWQPWLYWAAGAVSALLLFGSVLLHELGHSLVARAWRVPVKQITLFIFGGVAQIAKEPPSALAELLIAAAGPAVSLALAGIGYALLPVMNGSEAAYAVVGYVAFINAALVVFNLVPGFPLDGGRVFRAIVWGATGSFRRATIIAANVGRGFALLFIFLGVWQLFSGNIGGGLWIAFIGWFLDMAATAQLNQLALDDLLAGHHVLEAMRRDFALVPADATLAEIADHYVATTGRRAFIVRRNDEALGLLSLHRLRLTPREDWPHTTAEQAMVPMDHVTATQPEAELKAVLRQMDEAGVSQVPVIQDRRLTGMLSREDVLGYLQTLKQVHAT